MSKLKIEPDIMIQDLVVNHPYLVTFLIEEYDFHCIGCFMSQFDTLREGARTHGIEGEDFDQLLAELNIKVFEFEQLED